MGTEINGNTNSNIEQLEPKTGTDKKRTSGNRNTKTTGTGNGTSGTGTGTSGTGNGTSGTGSTKTIKTEKSSKVSVLADLPDVNIPEPQQPKQKRKYTKKAKEEDKTSFDSKQISAFIVAVSSMVASREGMQHWLISESEAEQISKPLSNIIAKSEQLKVLGEHADAFALVTACLMIFAPRLIVTLQINKSKKGVKKADGKHNDRKSTDSNKQVHRENAVTPSNDGKTIFESISAIQ